MQNNPDEAVPALVWYLAGPIGSPASEEEWAVLRDRIEYSSFVQGKLARRGIASINPYSTALCRGNWELDREVWYRLDMELLKFCDSLLLLPGWQDSHGVTNPRGELAMARYYGLTIYEWDAEKEIACLKHHE